MSRFYYLGLTSRMEEKYAGGRTGKGSDDTVLACALALWAVRQCPPGVRADFEMRHARIPDAIDLGLNRTNPGAEFFGKGLLADQYGGVEVPEELANLFDLGVDEQLVSACPMGGSWAGMGLDLYWRTRTRHSMGPRRTVNHARKINVAQIFCTLLRIL